MQPPETIESMAWPRRSSLVEGEFGGRIGIAGGAQRPLAVVQVQRRADRAQVHVGFVVGVDGADVAPVGRRVRRARRECGWSGNRRRTSRARPTSDGQNVAAEIVRAVLDCRRRRAARAAACAWRRCSCPWRRRRARDRPAWSARPGSFRGSRRCGRPASVSITPNSAACSLSHRDGGDGHLRALLLVELDHAARCSCGRCGRRRRSPPRAGRPARSG